jgi:arabinofuranosyltransferase
VKKRWDLLLLLPLCVVLGWFQFKYWGYIKDDTYIALRYARNLAEGHGMVFNYGQRLEGYTDFLWIVLTVPAFWLKIDPVVWVKVLGCLSAQVGLVLTYEIARFFGRDRTDAYSFAAPLVWAFSASVILWSTAGMEPPLMAVLCSGGIFVAMLLWERGDDSPQARRLGWIAGLLLAGGALCRPEGHAVVLFAAAFGLADAIRQKRIPKPWLICAAVIAGVLAPYHIWRLTYFGNWLPNTYLAKASTGSEVYAQGFEFAKSLLAFEVNGGVFALAVVALLGRKRWIGKAFAAALGLFFLAYLVKVGRDEMKWFRLYLPVYPLVIALAADGLRQLGQGLGWAVDKGRSEPLAQGGRGQVAIAVVLLAVVAVPTAMICTEFALKHDDRHDKYVRWSEQSFQAMGRYIRERSEPGEVVVFQDMGAAPFAAGDLRWVDTIGILDANVSHELATVGVNPFARSAKRKMPGGAAELKEMDRRLRDYFLAQDPSWIAFIAYVPKKKRRKLWKRYRRIEGDPADEEEIFLPYIRGNSHSHYLARDPRFQEGFHYVKAWDRLDHGYWCVLYRADDHVDARDR